MRIIRFTGLFSFLFYYIIEILYRFTEFVKYFPLPVFSRHSLVLLHKFLFYIKIDISVASRLI